VDEAVPVTVAQSADATGDDLLGLGDRQSFEAV
jgi:hypothetical protein